MTTIFQDFIALFFPRLCAGCGCSLIGKERFICLHCFYHLPLTNFHTYRDNDTARQLWGKIVFEHACSFLHLQQNSRVERILYQIKYQNEPALATYLGSLYAEQLVQTHFFSSIDVIIPIPLHNKKLKKRGYNQSYHFALGLAEQLALPIMEDGLTRVKDTKSQTGMQRLDRYENVSNVFECNTADSLHDKHIMLVDDVITTGATIVEAANILQTTVKNCRITVVTLARA